MIQTFECPNCHASLDYEPRSQGVTVRCDFCNSTVIVPETLRTGGAASYSGDVPNTPLLDPISQATQLGEVVKLVRSGRKIEAIKLFRETFHVGLKEAKDVVDQMERNETIRLGTMSVQAFGSSSSSFTSTGYSPVMTDTLGQPIGQRSSAGRTIGCIVAVILIITALATIVPVLIGGGFAIWGVQEADDIIATVESGFSVMTTPGSSSPVGTSTPVATPTPGFASIALQIGGEEGTGPGFFDDTRQIGVDAEGNLYAGDYDSGRVQVFDATGEFLNTWNAGEIYMVAMAVDRSGVMYIPGNEGLLRFDGMSGEPLDTWTVGQFVSFRGVAAAPDGSIVAAASNRIVRWNADGIITLDIADPFNIAALRDMFPKPESITVDGSGNLYFTGNNEVIRFDNQGNFLGLFDSSGDAPDQFQGGLTAMAVDGRGRIFVENFKGISIFDNNGRYIDAIDSPGVAFDMVFNAENQLVYMDRNGNQIIVYTLNQ